MKKIKTIASLILIMFIIVTSMLVYAVSDLPVKKVLILHSDEEFMPANVDINAALVAELKKSDKFAITIFSEYMDPGRFYSEESQQNFKDSFIKRYKEIKPDIIIAVDFRAYTFLKEETDFYNDLPLVFCMIPKRLIDEDSLPKNVAGNYMSIDAKGSIELVMDMHPNTREIVIVSGAGQASKSKLNEINDSLLQLKEDVDIRFIQDLTMEETLNQLSNLEDGTIVLYNSIFEDAKGELFIPREALSLMNDATSVPIYGLYFTNLNYGLVGGSLFEFKEVAKDAAHKALKILDGTDPSTLPILEVKNKIYFNWSLFDRWQVDESRVPSEAIVLNKIYTPWELYRNQIIAVIVFIVVESLLIIYLVIQQGRRKRAEAALGQLNAKLEDTVEKRTNTLNVTNHELANKNELLEKEIEIRKSVEEELKAVVSALRDTQSQLVAVEKQAAINHLIQNLLHRINTPLGNNLLYIDVLDNKVQRDFKLDGVLEQLRINNQQLVSTMDTLNSMMYIDHDELETPIDLEKYIPILLYEVFMESKNNIVAICYPSQIIHLKEKNFRKVILSLAEFAKGQRVLHDDLGRAELIFELKSDVLTLYFKDRALDRIENVEKIFDPYIFNSFKNTQSGLELVLLYNTVTVGMKGAIEVVIDQGETFERVLKINIPYTLNHE